MESILEIIITILLTVFLAALGWFITLLYKFSQSLEMLTSRVYDLESRQAVDDSEKKTIWRKLDVIENKIDKVLAPGFFRECPHWKQEQ
jgi:hypothetical protein